MENKSYTLRQIASWTSNESEVLIPALQRGLVWKPRQVELLWDSILRGFPIGSFMLSDIVNNVSKGKYYLMDGQQRYNAISIGYNTVQNPRAILWIDIMPPTSKTSTRTYWVKATTMPHPWGFKNDDEANRLSASEKRNALNVFNLKGNIYNEHFSLTETWPIEANLPIPLFCLLEAAESVKCQDGDAFVNEVLANFYATNFSYRNIFKEKVEQSDTAFIYLRNTLFPAFKALCNYRISCNYLPIKVMETETSEDPTAQTTLEVLFSRLNTGGTAISRDDLNYSAIKAYWPSIKEANDDLADRYLSPAKLVMLAFRLALTTKDDKGFKNEMTIKQIRSAAKKPEEREKIEALYENNNLNDILEKVDEWLGVKENDNLRTPRIMRTFIARNSPDIYLLLMYLAHVDNQSPIELSAEQIRALAFLLHWFSDDKKQCVQVIFDQCKNGITYPNISQGLSQLWHDGFLINVYKPEEVKKFISINEFENHNIWKSIPTPAKPFYNRTSRYGSAEAKQILLYAERQYLNTHFSNYDPARQDMWAEENRPWDFDHIVPQEWIINKKRGDFREEDKYWLWSIGNMAAISFEANRSKSNSNEYSEYNKNKDTLYYQPEIESINSNITKSQEQSVKFTKNTYERYCMIYQAAYRVIQPIVEQCEFPKNLQERKDLLESVRKLLPNAIVHFAAEDGNDYLIEREQDWTRKWIGVGVVMKDFMVCYECLDEKHANVGIRKAPGEKITKENQILLNPQNTNKNLDDWWYDCNYDFQGLDAETIVKEMTHYIEIVQRIISPTNAD